MIEQNLCIFCLRVCNVRNTKSNEPVLECKKFLEKKEENYQTKLIGE